MGDRELLNNIKHVSRMLEEFNDPIAVLTHYDADGLSAGGAFTRLLTYLNKKYIVRSTPDLSENTIDDFFDINASSYIVSDLGSSDLNLLYNKWKETKSDYLVVIDHHKISERIPDDDHFIFLNPELYGLDGGKIGCTAILSSLIGYFQLKDPYFLEIGIVGATGDMQLNNELVDVNRYIVRKGIENNIIKKERDFIFFVNKMLPVYKAITWNYIPYIPHFSGRDDIGWQLVNKAGIPIRKEDGSYTTVADLSKKEKDRLLELILQYLSSLGLTDIKSSDLVVERYTFSTEEDPQLKSSVDFANLLNSTGRLGKEYLGILIAAGVRGDILDEAKSLHEERRKILAKYLDLADQIVSVKDTIIALLDFRGREFNPRFGGTISTIYSKSIEYQDKVVIVLSLDERGLVKISARAPRYLVEEGFNLAEVMRVIAKKFSGRGGGHNVAAGATVRNSKKLVDELIKVVKDHVKI